MKKEINKSNHQPLSYADWYSTNEDEIYIELAETGSDREMDFDSEREFDDKYEKYLNSHSS